MIGIVLNMPLLWMGKFSKELIPKLRNAKLMNINMPQSSDAQTYVCVSGIVQFVNVQNFSVT